MRPAIVAVWTRDLDGAERFGRVNVALQVRDALHSAGTVTHQRLTIAFEDQRPATSLLASVKALLAGILSARPLPLQCMLFAASARQSSAAMDCQGAHVVYLDGIRTLLLLRRLRKLKPKLRIVVDLDDLMSRRYDALRRKGFPLSLGYIENLLPPRLARLISGRLAQSILWYERLALRHAEAEVLRLADAVVLLNRLEAEMLRTQAAARGADPRAEVVAIPPPARPAATRQAKPSYPAGPWRAVFVGSDVLVQNRMTIAYLLDLWSRHKIQTRLHIYGRQKTKWPSVPNVTLCGYVDDIAEAYTPGSFVVYQCLMPGGIKTKILEAFAHGVPVIGNSMAFEGILPPGYPLVIDKQDELVAVLQEPGSRQHDFVQAAGAASAYLAREHTVPLFAKRWYRVMRGIG